MVPDEGDRAAVLHTMRVFRDLVVEVCEKDAALALQVHDDEGSVLDLLLDLACGRTGLDRASYDDALRADPCLIDLQDRSLLEIILGTPDPGPYSAISRESPAGTAANWHLHAWNGITPPGGVGGSGRPR